MRQEAEAARQQLEEEQTIPEIGLAPQHVSGRDHMRYNVDGQVGFTCSGNFNDATNLRKEDLEEKLSNLFEVDAQLGFVVAV